MCFFKPRLHKLRAADGPKVEVIVADHEGPEALGKDLPVGHEFGAARAQRGPYGRSQPRGVATEFRSHGGDDATEKAASVSSPSAMNIGNHFPQRVVKDHGLAVRLFHEKGHTGHIGDHGIRRERASAVLKGTVPHDQDVPAMNLVHEPESPGTREFTDQGEIGRYARWAVPCADTHIEASESGVAHASMSCEDKVCEVRTKRETWKLIKRDLPGNRLVIFSSRLGYVEKVSLQHGSKINQGFGRKRKGKG